MIAKTGTRLCPVTNIKRYKEWSNLCSEDFFLLCNLNITKSGNKVRNGRKAMSYSNLCYEFMTALSSHVKDDSKYCLHCYKQWS